MHPIERIQKMSRYNPDNGCWEWIGALNDNNRKAAYGSMTIGSRTDGSRKKVSAHRYSYMVFIGMIPDDLFVCHSCDNSICVNPKHLFLGTRQDNTDDRERKGRNYVPRGENHAKAILKEADVINIYRLLDNGIRNIEISRMYKIEKSAVSNIRTGKNWKQAFAKYRHLPQPPKQ